jgi:hypothetical protein
MAGDQVKTLCLLLRQRKKPDGTHYTVWYDNEMGDRSTPAMEEGVRCSNHFLLFLSGDPDMWDNGKGKDKEGSNRKLFSQLCRCGEHATEEEEYKQLARHDCDAQRSREGDVEQAQALAPFEQPEPEPEPEPRVEAMQLNGQPHSQEPPPEQPRPVLWEKCHDDEPAPSLARGRKVWVATEYRHRLTSRARDKIWQRGEVVAEKDDSNPWPLVLVEGETEARAYFFIDTAVAPGLTFVDVLASPKTSTWAYAAERNGLSPAAAFGKGLGRLIFWHLIQPPLYFLVFVACADLIDPLQLGLGIAVGVREAIYFLGTLACCWANPAFLLVDVGASVRLEDSEMIWGGYWFLIMYVLAPEKYVGLSLFSDGGLGAIARNRGACGGLAYPLSGGLGVTCLLLDLAGVAALISGWGSGSLPVPLAVGYSVTTSALVATIIAGVPKLMAQIFCGTYLHTWSSPPGWVEPEAEPSFVTP